MSGITFFAKPAFLAAGNRRLMRATSEIRGQQIADFLGAKLNPISGYQDDVCIYVKPYVKPPYDFEFEGRPYLDVIDTYKLIDLAKKYPDVTVIACSEVDKKLLSGILENPVILIPQHHCNFERLRRTRNDIATVGTIANPGAMTHVPKKTEERLAEIGLKFVACSDFRQRQDVLDFYQQIDIQMVWRPWYQQLTNPLKMVNAAAFGIPSVAYEEEAFQEMGDCYLPVNDLDEFIAKVQLLKNTPAIYDSYSEKCYIKAEDYHIEKIGDLYRGLCTT